MAPAPWDRLAIERRAAADFFSTVTAEEWQQPSCCAGWSNRDVLAHLVDGAQSTPGRFIRTFVSSGFSFDKFIAKGLVRQAGRPVPDLLADWASLLDRHTQPAKAMVGEAVVHAEDIRYALGHGVIGHDPDNVRFVADNYVAAGAPIKGKGRAAGLRLVATDTEWHHGDGPVVEGPLLALVMAVAGRKQAYAELSGEGLSRLGSRH